MFLEFSDDCRAAALLILLFTCYAMWECNLAGHMFGNFPPGYCGVHLFMWIIFGGINYELSAQSKQENACNNSTVHFDLQISEPQIVILFSRPIHWLIYTWEFCNWTSSLNGSPGHLDSDAVAQLQLQKNVRYNTACPLGMEYTLFFYKNVFIRTF